MARRAEGRDETGRNRRRPHTEEPGLVVHIYEVADGEAATDQLECPRPSFGVGPDETDEVSSQTIGLHVGFREEAITIVFHQIEQLTDLALDRPEVGLPFEMGRIEPSFRQ